MKKTIVYNLENVPMGVSLATILMTYEKTGILFYSGRSYNGKKIDCRPYLLDKGKGKGKILIDVSSEKGKKKYEEILKDIR